LIDFSRFLYNIALIHLTKLGDFLKKLGVDWEKISAVY